MAWHDRLFAALLRVLPAEFRGEYGHEMSATFRAERREAHGAASLTRLWLATIVDLCRTAPAEHVEILRRDLVFTVRVLARRPGLTLTTILMLALGIGANTAIFSLVNGVLLAPLAYRHAGRIVLIDEQSGAGSPGMTGYQTYADLRRQNLTLEASAAFGGWSATLTGDGRETERVTGARVTWDYFRTLGLEPATGRDFDRADDRPNGSRVALISDALWRRRYGADPAIVGRLVTVNQSAFRIAGVMPPAGDILTATKFPDTEIWTLLGYDEQTGSACRSCRHLEMVARLKPGVTRAQAEADLARVFQQLAVRYPGEYDRARPIVALVRDYLLGPVATPLYLLWGAVALLLVIACANVANLLLLRASEREEEIAVRRALGVSPPRLLRQLLTEAVTLAVLGGAVGAALAWWVTTVLTTNGPADIPRLSAVSLDWRVLGYALALSVITGVVFGLAPIRMLVAHGELAGVSSGRRTTGRRAWHARAALVAANVALSVLLLVGSGLLVRSFTRLLTVDAGFRPHRLLTFRLDLVGDRYQGNASYTAFFDAVTSRLQSVPGIERVSASSLLPMTDGLFQMGIRIEGRPFDNPAAAPVADTYTVRPDYFTTMGIPLLEGRAFNAMDDGRAVPVAIVGRAMAEALWPGESPIGRRIQVPPGGPSPIRTIVGIVGDVRQYGLHLPVTNQVYLPQAQPPWPMRSLTFVARLAPDRDPLSLAATLRESIARIDPLQPVSRIQTYDEIVARSMAMRRFTLLLLAVFASTAVLLAIGGLYGALSYVVTQRSRDIGVRLVLGASGRTIRRLVLRQGMAPAMTGLAFGLVASMIASRVIASMLFGVTPRDLATYATVIVLIVAGALAACLLPARRAASVDPAVILRAQ